MDQKQGHLFYARDDPSYDLRPDWIYGREILLTFHNNHQYKIEFSGDASKFDSEYVQDIEKKAIDSIKWLR